MNMKRKLIWVAVVTWMALGLAACSSHAAAVDPRIAAAEHQLGCTYHRDATAGLGVQQEGSCGNSHVFLFASAEDQTNWTQVATLALATQGETDSRPISTFDGWSAVGGHA